MTKILTRAQKTWHRFIRKSALYHFFLFLIALFLFTLSITLIAYLTTYGADQLGTADSFRNIKHIGLDLMLGMNKTQINPVWRLTYYPGMVILTAIWQALLIFKILTRPDDIRFSKSIALYPAGSHEETEDKDFIAIKLYNRGTSPLFDVKVKAVLKHYAKDHNTIQHYICDVENSLLPLLEPNLPFRIYIHTGHLEKINDSVEFDPLEAKVDVDTDEYISIAKEKEKYDDDQPIDQLIVYIRALDKDLGEEEVAVKKYPIKDIEVGHFEEITVTKNGKNEPKVKINELEEKIDGLITEGFKQPEP